MFVPTLSPTSTPRRRATRRVLPTIGVALTAGLLVQGQGRTAAREAVQNMLSEHGDVARESGAFMVRELTEAGVSQLVGARSGCPLG